MKVSTTIFSFLFSFSSLAANLTWLESSVSGNKLSITQTAQELLIHSKDFRSQFKDQKCSGSAVSNLKKEIEKKSAKSFNYSGKDAIKVNVFGKTRSIAPASPLSLYLKNFTQHMITFQSQVKLACQKK